MSSCAGGHLAAAGGDHPVQDADARRAALPRGQLDLVTPRAVAHRVQRRVVGDGEEPGGELRPGGVLLPRPEDPQEHLLREVFGQFAAAHQVFQHPHQARLVADHQFLEGGGAIVADLEHQPHVGIQGVSLGRRLADDHNGPRDW